MTSQSLVDPLIGIQIDGYRLSVKLGEGSFGKVYRGDRVNLAAIADSVTSLDDIRCVVAVKCIERRRLSPSGRENLVTEIETLKKLSHPNIVQLVNISWDPTRIYILTEFCAGGDLTSFLRKKGSLPESVISRMSPQLISALSYLHSLDIAHLDIKPQNILLTLGTEPILKLADFGFARELKAPTKALVGSLLYMAPEMVQKGVVDKRADIWSLGTVFYELFYGIPLFASKNEEELVMKLTSDDPIKLPRTPRTSVEFREFLFCLLQRNPEDRFTIESIKKHPFLLSKAADQLTRPSSALNHADLISQHSKKTKSLPIPSSTRKSEIDAETLELAFAINKTRPQYVDNVASAVFNIEQAIAAEQHSNWESAFHLYTDAIESFMVIHQNVRQDSNVSDDIKRKLRSTLDDWLKRGEIAKRKKAETLKKSTPSIRINVNATGNKSLASNSVGSAHANLSNRTVTPDPSKSNSELLQSPSYMTSLAESCLLQ